MKRLKVLLIVAATAAIGLAGYLAVPSVYGVAIGNDYPRAQNFTSGSMTNVVRGFSIYRNECDTTGAGDCGSSENNYLAAYYNTDGTKKVKVAVLCKDGANFSAVIKVGDKTQNFTRNNCNQDSYRTYELEAETRKDDDTGWYSLEIDIDMNSGAAHGAAFFYTVTAPGGLVANRKNDSHNKTNTAIIGRKQLNNGKGFYIKAVYGFGLKCGVSNNTDKTVYVYDADNWENGPDNTKVKFRIFEQRANGTWRALSSGDYKNVSNGSKGSSGGMAYVQPSHNSNAKNTSVKIAMKPDTRYELRVWDIWSGSTNPQVSSNYIAVGLPEDSIYGHNSFKCEGTPSVTSKVSKDNSTGWKSNITINSANSSEASRTVYFRHSVKAEGGKLPGGSIARLRQFQDPGSTSWRNGNSGLTLPSMGINEVKDYPDAASSRKYVVPQNADPGTYCERYRVKSNIYSTKACVTITRTNQYDLSVETSRNICRVGASTCDGWESAESVAGNDSAVDNAAYHKSAMNNTDNWARPGDRVYVSHAIVNNGNIATTLPNNSNTSTPNGHTPKNTVGTRNGDSISGGSWNYRSGTGNLTINASTVAPLIYDTSGPAAADACSNFGVGNNHLRCTISPDDAGRVFRHKYWLPKSRGTATATPRAIESLPVVTYVPYNYRLVPRVETINSSVEPGSIVPVNANVSNSDVQAPGGNKATRSKESFWKLSAFVVGADNDDPAASWDDQYVESGGSGASDDLRGALSNEIDSLKANTYAVVGQGGGTYGVTAGSTTTTLGSGSAVVGANNVSFGDKFCVVASVFHSAVEDDDNSGQWAHSKPSCAVVGKQPKVAVVGGDVIAGKGASGKTIDTSITIKSRHETDTSRGTTMFGSWGEYGAFASGSISNFGTAGAFASAEGSQGVNSDNLLDIGLIGGAAGPCASSTAFYNLLTFANAGRGATSQTACDVDTQGRYQYASSVRSITDMLPATGASIGAYGYGEEISSLSPSDNDTYVTTGNISIRGGDAGIDRTVIIRAGGTVRISGNIVTEDWNDDDMPQVIIMAKDIMIQHNVTQVDAWLLATGEVNTCVEVSPRATEAGCGRQLVVNGPVSTGVLRLKRTYGAGPKEESGTPAEVFNLSSDAYFWAKAYAEKKQPYARTTYIRDIPPRF